MRGGGGPLNSIMVGQWGGLHSRKQQQLSTQLTRLTTKMLTLNFFIKKRESPYYDPYFPRHLHFEQKENSTTKSPSQHTLATQILEACQLQESIFALIQD